MEYPDKVYTAEEAIAYCKRLARTHYENFTVVGPLLPRRLRIPFYIIYAWCRYADDLADETNDPEEALRLLDHWEDELVRAFAHDSDDLPRHPIPLALRELVRQHQLTIEPFRDLINAFRQDQTKHSYESMDELLEYCRYSANPVGRILLHLILGQPSRDQILWSDAICTGLQLTNFWQDVTEDDKRGRRYIPNEVVRHNPEFVETMKYLVVRTRAYFEEGKPLIATLPFPLWFDIALFHGGGMAVLDKIERCGYRTDRARPVLSRFDKIRIAFRALFTASQ